MNPGGTFASTLVRLTRALGNALVSENIARQAGLLQSLDPRVRVAGLLLMVLAVTLAHKLTAILGVFAFAVGLALLSRVSLRMLVRVRRWACGWNWSPIMRLGQKLTTWTSS